MGDIANVVIGGATKASQINACIDAINAQHDGDTGSHQIPSLEKLYLDGGDDTYIIESAANNISFFTNDALALLITTANIISQHSISIPSLDKLFLDGGDDTYIIESAPNNITFFTNDAQAFLMTTATVTSYHNFVPSTDSAKTLGTNALCWLNIYGDAGVTACSMRKYKTNIKTEELGLDFIDAIQPISFDWKSIKGNRGRFRGVLSDEIQAVLDQVGYTEKFAGIVEELDENGDPWMGFRYEQLLSPIIKAIQELKAMIVASQ